MTDSTTTAALEAADLADALTVAIDAETDALRLGDTERFIRAATEKRVAAFRLERSTSGAVAAVEAVGGQAREALLTSALRLRAALARNSDALAAGLRASTFLMSHIEKARERVSGGGDGTYNLPFRGNQVR